MTDAPVSSPLSRKIILNTLFNFVGRSWAMFIGLLLTPYIVSTLGVQRFGVWSLIFVITSYLGLLDLGTGTAFVKYVAEYYTRRDYDAINSIVNTGFAFYLTLAFVLIALVVAFNDSILHLFRIPPEILDEARFVLLGGIVILSLSNALSTFQAVTKGLQRMDVTNVIALAVSVPDVIGTIVFLQLGYGLKGLIVKEAIVFVLTASLFVLYAFKLLPSLRVGFRFCQRERLRELLGYGLKVQVSQLADLVSSQVDKVLLGYFLGLSPVALYELGSKVVFTSKRLSRVLTSAIMPAASEIKARRDPQTLLLLYLRGSKYLVLVAAPLFFLIIFAAPLIMRAWMGRGYELSALVIQSLALGHFVHLLTGVGTMIVKGIGKPEVETRYTLLLLVMNIVLGVALVIRLGFLGVLIATPFSLIASSLYFMVIVHRLLRISLLPFIRDTYLKPVLASLVASLPFFALNHFTWPLLLPDGRLNNLVLLGSAALLFASMYLAVLLKSDYLDSYDRGILMHIGQAILRT
jgi:O-antigen/teichoic acid export membrane protein